MFSKSYTIQFPEKLFIWSSMTGGVNVHGIETTWKFAILEISLFTYWSNYSVNIAAHNAVVTISKYVNLL